MIKLRPDRTQFMAVIAYADFTIGQVPIGQSSSSPQNIVSPRLCGVCNLIPSSGFLTVVVTAGRAPPDQAMHQRYHYCWNSDITAVTYE